MAFDTPAGDASAGEAGEKPQPKRFLPLVLGSIGVVYGDIGTSPLYAFREAVKAGSDGPAGEVSEVAVIGVLSLIIWALVIVVTINYVLVLLRADNNGEGGPLALMALAQRAIRRGKGVIVLLGAIAAALFYGDAIITPAISVMSAVEGINIATPALEHYILPVTVVIIVALFLVQSRGTGRVATFFGPIMAIWFVTIAVAGLPHVIAQPAVLVAFNPVYAVTFVAQNWWIGLVTLGAIFLSVTGAEALYADLGHFGRRPIQTAWLGLVAPALILNYLGQGALVLDNHETIANPFYLLVADWALVPMVALATAATVIASQAVISGAYSLTRQAIQLGLLPRQEIRHTSETQVGQIYMPRINFILLIGVLLLVVVFGSSSSMAAAYGVAVSGTMVVDALMGGVVVANVWRWGWGGAVALMGPLLLIDLIFLGANLAKVHDGGWVPLMVGGIVLTIILTWRRGSRILLEKTRRLETPLDSLIRSLERHPPPQVPGTAVFLTSDPDSAPTALLHSLKHFKVLHEKNVVLTIETADLPRIAPSERVKIEPLTDRFTRITVRYGFMEVPNVPRALAIARKLGWTFDIMSTSFFLSRRSIRPSPSGGMPRWQDRIFILLARNADDATSYFQIPTGRVVEVGTQVVV